MASETHTPPGACHWWKYLRCPGVHPEALPYELVVANANNKAFLTPPRTPAPTLSQSRLAHSITGTPRPTTDGKQPATPRHAPGEHATAAVRPGSL
ncbi:MAG: hypothetical protein J07HX5_01744 [halophilic archaeon J07HX5]|nr:MAG: hypothetical protein J07HX5_01744 [halophilic archaeon J07HX5]